MKARKLSSGRYLATAYLGKDLDGKQVRRSFTAETARDAVALAMDFARKNRQLAARGSFETTLRAFLEYRKADLSPTTYADYLSRSRVLLADFPAFCKNHMQTITADDIRALVRDLTATRPSRHKYHHHDTTMSPKTVKNYLGLVRAVFRFADLEMPRVKVADKTPREIYVPTDAEVRALLHAAEGTELYFADNKKRPRW